MRIRGAEVVSVSGNGQADPVDPEAVIHPGTSGDSSTRAVYHLRSGVYRIEFFYYEAAGGDNGELYAAKGAFAADADTAQWRLVGDLAPPKEFAALGVSSNGWSVVSSDPGGDTQLNTWAEAFAIGGHRKCATNYARLFIGDPQTNNGYTPSRKNTSGDDDWALRANATLVVPVSTNYVIGSTRRWSLRLNRRRSFTEIIANTTGFSVIDPADTVTCDC